MQTLLREAGVRPINAIVDITNYVMLATGQPMHAFATAAIASSKGKVNVEIRKATTGEKITALDEETYKLDSSMLVIANEKTADSDSRRDG